MLKQINNNKILVISHFADIDGMGSIILSKFYFKDFDFLLADNNHDFDLENDIDTSIYDTIYICDLGFNDKNLKYCLEHPEVAMKIKNFDHHESEEEKNKYSFVNEVFELNGHATCATELFYNYLLTLPNSEFLQSNFFKELVEAICTQDTWTFEERNNTLGPDLAVLHSYLGALAFIDLITGFDCTGDFYLPKNYEDIIIRQNEIAKRDIENYISKSKLIEFNNYKIAVSISEGYRSSVGDALMRKYPDADFALIINFYRFTCSLRTDNDKYNLGLIAQEFTSVGGGHKRAAGFKFDEESIPKINSIISKYLYL
jgi:hypothetical protein